MHKISANFQPLDKVSLTDLFNQVGVYVLWDGQARVKPSYIGEGDVLDRIVNHSREYAAPLNGYISLLGSSTGKKAKLNAEILETLLLQAAHETKRTTPNNVQKGKIRGIEKAFRKHGMIRITLNGYDPFQHIKRRIKWVKAKYIRLSKKSIGSASFEHPWKHIS